MLSKSKLSFLRRLQTKKGRNAAGLFIGEGVKIVDELLRSGIKVVEVYRTRGSNFEAAVPGINVFDISADELKKISTLTTPHEVLAVAAIPEWCLETVSAVENLVLVLDDIQDPGNMGTIIRIADWFGIEHIVCSFNTADCFSPKVVQAAMGSIARVKVHYTNLVEFISVGKNTGAKNAKVYGAVLGGRNLYSQKPANKGFLIIGNEGKGISPGLQALLTDKISIPNYSQLVSDRGRAESLNAAVATAVICAEFRRVPE